MGHIIPCSFFLTSEGIGRFAVSSLPINLRNIPAAQNNSRKDYLTIAEIKTDTIFLNPEIRVLYGLAGNIEKKLERGLPETLPVDQDEFLEWINNTSTPKSHQEKYDSWISR